MRSLRQRLTTTRLTASKEGEAVGLVLAAANAKVAALEASLSETQRGLDACAAEQQKQLRRVAEVDAHASKLVTHAESLMEELAVAKAGHFLGT